MCCYGNDLRFIYYSNTGKIRLVIVLTSRQLGEEFAALVPKYLLFLTI